MRSGDFSCGFDLKRSTAARSFATQRNFILDSGLSPLLSATHEGSRARDLLLAHRLLAVRHNVTGLPFAQGEEGSQTVRTWRYRMRRLALLLATIVTISLVSTMPLQATASKDFPDSGICGA